MQSKMSSCYVTEMEQDGHPILFCGSLHVFPGIALYTIISYDTSTLLCQYRCNWHVCVFQVWDDKESHIHSLSCPFLNNGEKSFVLQFAGWRMNSFPLAPDVDVSCVSSRWFSKQHMAECVSDCWPKSNEHPCLSAVVESVCSVQTRGWSVALS